ncbi:MAG: radical SAM protein [Candidatus Helarchaeota archaeon]|nr:radical SAM protein [Candidatus Helarchaeota archaeon]
MEFIWTVRRYFQFRVNGVPPSINYDITYRCQLNCEHCYFARSWIKDRKDDELELTDEQWKRVFKKHYSMGITNASITGGEPTLRMPVVEAAYDTFNSIQVATNGIIPIPERLKCVVWVSIDGGEETHNRIRGAKCYQKIMRNIQDDKRIAISMSLSTSNYKEIFPTIEACLKANIKGIFFLLYTGQTTDSLYLTGKQLDYTIKSLYHAIDEYGDFILISKRMVDLYKTKKHVKDCIFRKGLVQSFYPDMSRKLPCVMGPVDCRTCGCIVPVFMYWVKRLDIETMLKGSKMLATPV